MNKIYTSYIASHGEALLDTIPDTQSFIRSIFGDTGLDYIVSLGEGKGESPFHIGLTEIIESNNGHENITGNVHWKTILKVRAQRTRIENLLGKIDVTPPEHQSKELMMEDDSIKIWIKKTEVFVTIVNKLLENNKKNSR